jgi:hypothetical protein
LTDFDMRPARPRESWLAKLQVTPLGMRRHGDG